MSTSVIRPGVATKQTPSGKNLVMLVAGVAVAIAVGFAFYTSQSQDVTVSGAAGQVDPKAEAYAISQTPGAAAIAEKSAQVGSAANAAQLERKLATDAVVLTEMAEAYATSQSLALERKFAAGAVALTEMAEAYARSQNPALQELADKIRVSQIRADQIQGGVNPAFGHEFESELNSGPGGSGNPITLPVR